MTEPSGSSARFSAARLELPAALNDGLTRHEAADVRTDRRAAARPDRREDEGDALLDCRSRESSELQR
jgi:hypothetical protein